MSNPVVRQISLSLYQLRFAEETYNLPQTERISIRSTVICDLRT